MSTYLASGLSSLILSTHLLLCLSSELLASGFSTLLEEFESHLNALPLYLQIVVTAVNAAYVVKSAQSVLHYSWVLGVGLLWERVSRHGDTAWCSKEDKMVLVPSYAPYRLQMSLNQLQCSTTLMCIKICRCNRDKKWENICIQNQIQVEKKNCRYWRSCGELRKDGDITDNKRDRWTSTGVENDWYNLNCV